ncbi:hypothetical protein K438DRAFT_1774803 [Mycena galopus ATCC 62051]|nr:hypothetical protein K438DRAFT_1774803 [Mycena galopus ATCC 62051]
MVDRVQGQGGSSGSASNGSGPGSDAVEYFRGRPGVEREMSVEQRRKLVSAGERLRLPNSEMVFPTGRARLNGDKNGGDFFIGREQAQAPIKSARRLRRQLDSGKAILPQQCRSGAAVACCPNFSGSLRHSSLRHMLNCVARLATTQPLVYSMSRQSAAVSGNLAATKHISKHFAAALSPREFILCSGSHAAYSGTLAAAAAFLRLSAAVSSGNVTLQR